MRIFHCCFLVALLLGISRPGIAAEARIAAAASLTHALDELIEAFEAETDHRIKLSLASSGNLVQQIIAGAPFELFLSANSDYVEKLYNQDLTLDHGYVYARGELALFVNPSSSLKLVADLSSLKEYFQFNPQQLLSIANPTLAPYGTIAMEALQNAKLWQMLSEHLVVGESASQAARFALDRKVVAALLPLSLALLLEKQGRGRFIRVSNTLYKPLEQRMVLLRPAGSVTREFYQFLQTPDAQRVLKQHGFGQ